MINSKQARNYLEIGVRDGATIVAVECPSIGVDPNFEFNLNPVGKKKSLYLFQMTSDVFFRDHDVRALLNSPVDVVFLDGLHLFEFLLRDFINSERASHRSGLIMLDDCLPVNAEMTERYHDVATRADQDVAGWWTGDVWKLLPILKRYRPDLRILPVDTPPTGTVCITNLDPSSRVLEDSYFEIVDAFRHLTLDDGSLEQFYSDNQVLSSHSILERLDASLSIGP